MKHTEIVLTIDVETMSLQQAETLAEDICQYLVNHFPAVYAGEIVKVIDLDVEDVV